MNLPKQTLEEDREDSAYLVAGWLDDDTEYRIPDDAWGHELAHALRVLVQVALVDQ